MPPFGHEVRIYEAVSLNTTVHCDAIEFNSEAFLLSQVSRSVLSCGRGEEGSEKDGQEEEADGKKLEEGKSKR